MNDEIAFLEAIRANPAEDGPRLVFADWLDERGDPYGEFVRVQCALAARASGPNAARRFDREADLLRRHGDDWRSRLPRVDGVRFEFHRGLPRAVTHDFYFVQEHGEQVLSHPAVHSLRMLRRRGGEFLDRCECLRRLTSLSLQESPPDGRIVRPLCSCEFLDHVQSLDLSQARLSPTFLLRLAESRNFRLLRHLDLSHNDFRPRHWAAVAALVARLPCLTSLDLSCNTLDHRSVDLLFRNPDLSRLTTLRLAAADLDDTAVCTLAHCRCLSGLRVLDLRHNLFGVGAVQRMAELACGSGLTRLVVSRRSELGEDTIRRLRDRFGEVVVEV